MLGKREGNIISNSRAIFKSIHRRCSVKKVFLNILQISQEKILEPLFNIKLMTFRPATLLKRDSNTGVFLWNLQNILEHLLSGTSISSCLWIFTSWTRGPTVTFLIHFHLPSSNFWDDKLTCLKKIEAVLRVTDWVLQASKNDYNISSTLNIFNCYFFSKYDHSIINVRTLRSSTSRSTNEDWIKVTTTIKKYCPKIPTLISKYNVAMDPWY